MKKILIIILFLACNPIMLSQEKDSLIIGEWKVICIDTENYYYDSTTDSFIWSKNFEKMLPKLIKDFGYKSAEEFSEYTKKKTINDKFTFQNDGIYLRKSDTQILRQGNYRMNSSKKIIYFKDKNIPEYSMKFSMKKGLLYLTIIFNSSIKLKSTKFILQKTTTS